MTAATAAHVPARTDDSIAFDDAAAHAAPFSAVVQLTGPDTAGIKNAVLTAELLDWRRTNPAASSEEIAAHVAIAWSQADKAVPDSDGDGQSRFALVMAVVAGLGVSEEESGRSSVTSAGTSRSSSDSGTGAP